MAEMSTAEVARTLGVTRQHVDALLNSGALTGRMLDGHRWLVESNSVRAYDAIRTGRGSRWSPEASWAVLDTLEGSALPADRKLRHRTAARIRTLNAQQLARKVATRVTAHRFAAEGRDEVAAELALTGGSAAEGITELTGASPVAQGYLRTGELEDFIIRHLLIPASDGNLIVYDGAGDRYGTTEPGRAVVAADLVRSTNTRERSAGITLLEGLQAEWLDSLTK